MFYGNAHAAYIKFWNELMNSINDTLINEFCIKKVDHWFTNNNNWNYHKKLIYPESSKMYFTLGKSTGYQR